MANLVKITTFLTDARHQPEYRAVREEVLGKKMPASTGLVVQALWHPDCLIEVEGIAVLSRGHLRSHYRELPGWSTTEPD